LGLHQRGAHKSFNQPQHSSLFNSVERVHDVIPVKHGKEALIDRRGRSIALVRSTTPRWRRAQRPCGLVTSSSHLTLSVWPDYRKLEIESSGGAIFAVGSMVEKA
jgi:hypothetical protein